MLSVTTDRVPATPSDPTENSSENATDDPVEPRRRRRLGLLPRVLIAIVLGIGCGLFFPDWLVRGFATFNGLFSNYLGFVIPLIIVGLITPAISELGKGAGKWLGITAAIAYGSTLFAGFLGYGPFLDPSAASALGWPGTPDGSVAVGPSGLVSDLSGTEVRVLDAQPRRGGRR